MVYEVVMPPGIQAPEETDLVFDNPRAVRACLEYLRRRLGDIGFKVLRDGKPLGKGELEADEKSHQIRTVMEEDSKLPGTFRHGWTGDSDLGSGADGKRHGVWRPKNPEDEYN